MQGDCCLVYGSQVLERSVSHPVWLLHREQWSVPRGLARDKYPFPQVLLNDLRYAESCLPWNGVLADLPWPCSRLHVYDEGGMVRSQSWWVVFSPDLRVPCTEAGNPFIRGRLLRIPLWPLIEALFFPSRDENCHQRWCADPQVGFSQRLEGDLSP